MHQLTNSSLDRIESLDVIRGFALLGILIMNIQSFSMPAATYLNPMAYGELTGINRFIWQASHLFADMKFMTIFTMLFGAGLLLFIQRAEQKSGRSIGIHYRRVVWLLIFGLLHAHLIWYGDILYSYAMCAFFIYWFRNLSIAQLLIVAFFLMIIESGFSVFLGLNFAEISQADIDKLMVSWKPDATALAMEIANYQSQYTLQFAQRSSQAMIMQTDLFVNVFVWRVTAIMLIGMALFKLKFFSLNYTAKQYITLAFISFLVGIPIVGFGLYENLSHQFSLDYSLLVGSQFNYWGSILVAISYIAFLCYWLKSDAWTGLKNRLACVGKMAFTHYILHSLIFTFVFYGHGLGLFGELSRWQAFILIIPVWLFQLWISPIWFKHFYYGPLEWLWRCLTYWKIQPFKNNLPVAR